MRPHLKKTQKRALFEPLKLPCGVTLKNRIVKAAMSDSLGDGTGHPTQAQMKLYQKWASGGASLSIIGEVQCSNWFAEKPGNLVLNEFSKLKDFRKLAACGSENQCNLWLQLSHAGALSYPPTSTPKGPSALDLPELKCGELTQDEIQSLPAKFAQTAKLAQQAGFGGVELHAAHGFLLSQFLSPLFNKRSDEYGGSISRRMLLLLQVLKVVRAAVGANFPIAVKLNSSDQILGGLSTSDALSVISALDETDIDLIEISGGTYFPGASASSDSDGKSPYFVAFAKSARGVTTKPLMATGGFKTLGQAETAVASGAVDMVGIARAFALEPSLANLWYKEQMTEPVFPQFIDPPKGGVTAWYTMRLTEIGENKNLLKASDVERATKAYNVRDLERTQIWTQHFSKRL